ncbi:MAG: hypothetical protein COB37_05400 [Kordiimonadales bacterium]|nr:MAG: hypothetical protein COB37_05400 [Kordiimonadales bacterium]
MSDELLFADTDELVVSQDPASKAYPWKILIVDDEPDIHFATKFALKGFHFDDRPLAFTSAESGGEARSKLMAEPDFALVFLDVVMESEDAGLKLVEYIRNELAYKNIRIVLRTGQPGQAPERDVIVRYDIDYYKEKNDLTANQLFSVTYSGLRCYRDIKALEASRRGLKRVIESSAHIFKQKFIANFADGVLEQVSALVTGGRDVAFTIGDAAAATQEKDGFVLVAGTGRFEDHIGESVGRNFPDAIMDFINAALTTGRGEYGHWTEEGYVGVVISDTDRASIIFLDATGVPSVIDTQLIDIFIRNVLIAVENLYLREALADTQREVVYRLSGAVETRSLETGNHVKRVAEISKLIALYMGMDEERAEILRMASPLHDIGKVGIPDAILNKPGRLDDDEMVIMRGHAELGSNILKDSKRIVLQIGAAIAHQHHEKWNGKGYPQGLKGTEIQLEARITAVADVFDALSSARCYKKPWPQQDVLDLLKRESGKQFEPAIVDALFANLDTVRNICERYADAPAVT